jgi:hypothetical protein
MCHLVTIGVDKSYGSSLPEFGDVREGLTVAPSRNPSVARIFPPGDLRFEITAGGCSCGLFNISASAQELSDREDAERRRYQKKGWSAAKIERALQASRVAHDRDQRGDNARRFQEAILALLERTRSVRIFAHMYSGLFDSEPVIAKGRTSITREDYQANRGALPEDVVVEIAG